ncbi:telokin 20 [Phthorimaea operculella granulovirus]|uniref:Telokin 20 n=1 Tax=Phthorimaea operculella granulovirus TaxID=192584 RepID=Q8JRW4_9BBAC|nr:telokin 20 [Phthorimaea operculella granulovirus]AAM70293.1 telokin 20 [Phthorimaea operculella granulovirus]ANY57484.1 telokin 20 [Phthorimaea operculella granulovirus]QBH65930.1 telokin 20 [Phthorimaea operculella granulovirus]QBH66060.1 telokin 20 [Phthorimaea operculella granulovirus]QBH66190.1 telokin 20 [Phthorimaea operculella granulovirus]
MSKREDGGIILYSDNNVYKTKNSYTLKNNGIGAYKLIFENDNVVDTNLTTYGSNYLCIINKTTDNNLSGVLILLDESVDFDCNQPVFSLGSKSVDLNLPQFTIRNKTSVFDKYVVEP